MHIYSHKNEFLGAEIFYNSPIMRIRSFSIIVIRCFHLRVSSWVFRSIDCFHPPRRSLFRILPVLCQLISVYSLKLRSTSVLGRVWFSNIVYPTPLPSPQTKATSRSSRSVGRNFRSGSSAELWHQDHHPRRIYLAECDTHTPAHRQLARESTRNSAQATLKTEISLNYGRF